MSDKLKPCPFCGGEADYDWGSTSDIGGALHQNGRVNCTNSNCDASIDVDSIDDNMSDKDLIAKWNNRIDDRMVEEIAELKGASDKLSEAIQLLTKIAYPIAAMEDEAESCGYDINVSQCISLSNDAEYLKDIAKQGLAKLNQEGEE